MPTDEREVPPPFGSWRWPRIPRLDAPAVVRQTDELGCGAACIVMLLADRGVHVALELVALGLNMPSDAQDLAVKLSSLHAGSWEGGSLEDGTAITWELVDYISRARGTWAALLEPFGPLRTGHWVVVDGIDQEGLILVRDPAGSAYCVPLGTFARLWGYTILVMQEPSP